MTKHEKPTIISVSRYTTSRRKKRSKVIIHVRIGSQKMLPSKNNSFIDTLPTFSSRLSASIPKSFLNSSKITHCAVNEKGTTDDYHRKSKRKKQNNCSWKYFVGSLLIIAVLILIVTAILLVVLIKPKSKIFPTSIPVLRWNKTGVTIAGITSTPGNSSKQLNMPLDVILNYANNLYVADTNNNRIQLFDRDSSIAQTIAGNGSVGISQYQLNAPVRVFLHSNSDLYVSDTINVRVQLFPSGSLLAKTVAGITGFPGSNLNQFGSPDGLSVDPISGTLYVSDSGNSRVVSYSSGATTGTLVLGGQGAGTNTTQLNNPVGLYFDTFSKTLVIANYGSSNIVRYAFGGTSWELVAELNYLVDMTFDPMGNMYVADRNNHRIQLFYANQSSGSIIAGVTGVNGNNATILNSPWAVRLDGQLNLYIADTSNHRIQKFLRY